MKTTHSEPTITDRACRATMKHVAILAKRFQTTNLAMFNALLLGSFRDELAEIM